MQSGSNANHVSMWTPLRLGVMVLAFAAGCSRPAPPSANTSGDRYAPGLGEIMTLQQIRHTKLWLAAEARNWPLAAYEIKELQEGFDDVIKFHPTHQGAPVAPKDAIPRMITVPLAQLQEIVDKKDAAAFAEAYDRITLACNECHEATNFGFNRVQRPAVNPYPNQVFLPPSR